MTIDRSAARPPAGTRVYAVGDIHGRRDLLEDILGQVERDAAAAAEPRKVVVFLGDYVDRGPDSAGVIDRLVAGPPAGFEWVMLKGNHEEFMLRFLEAPSNGLPWIMNGGDATLASYGALESRILFDPYELDALHEKLTRRLPEAHRRFLDGLALTRVEGGYLFVHAGIRPGVPLAQQDPRDLVWIRDEFLASRADHGHVVVHGHTPMLKPQVRDNRIGIDTGAFQTGVLTALALHGTERRFLHT